MDVVVCVCLAHFVALGTIRVLFHFIDIFYGHNCIVLGNTKVVFLKVISYKVSPLKRVKHVCKSSPHLWKVPQNNVMVPVTR